VRFRPCIDLRGGLVVQIVGETLEAGGGPETNFQTDAPASEYAERFRRDGLHGGHVIMLGPGNEEAAAGALAAFPGGLQIGGGIGPSNAAKWIERGASAVIATSYVFENGSLSRSRLDELVGAVGADRLVLDLSCAPHDGRYFVMADRWQTRTDLEVTPDTLGSLAGSCTEFLIHAVQVEGKQSGPDPALIQVLADSPPRPITYAGGIRSAEDIELIDRAGGGRLDFTVGSALDLFGGTRLRYDDLVRYGGGTP
jgi:phosphoribosylformimino-5-aminoimidazole carboxamide ribotide isomerase